MCVIDRGRSQPVTTLGELFRSPGTEAAARLSGCKNYADARPREDAVFLPDWGLTLSCGRPVPEGVCRIGIRAHHVQLAGPGAENAFSCTAVKVVEDVFSTIVSAAAGGRGAGGAPAADGAGQGQLAGGAGQGPPHRLRFRRRPFCCWNREGVIYHVQSRCPDRQRPEFRGERPDAGGPLVVEILKNAGYAVTETAIVPDEKGRIEAALRQWCDREPVDLIVTTGGTGFAPGM